MSEEEKTMRGMDEEPSMEDNIDALKNAEETAADSDTPEEDDESDAIPFREEKPRGGSLFGRLSRKQKTAGIITGFALTAGAGLSMIMAPNLLINHLRELITDRISQVQLHHTRSYRRSKMAKVADLFTRDGRMGGRMISAMEQRGYRFEFDRQTNKVSALYPPRSSIPLTGDEIGVHIDDYMEKRHPLRSSRWKTKRMNAMYQRFGVSRTSILAASTGAIDDPEVEFNKRMAQNVMGQPPDIRARAGDAPPNETEAERQAREASQAAVDDASRQTGVIGDIRSDLLEGVDADEAARAAGIAEGIGAVEQLGAGAGPSALRLAQQAASGASVASRVGQAFRNFFSPTDVLDKVCTVKGRLRMSTAMARNYRALAYMKYAAVFMRGADDIRAGRASSKYVSEMMKRIMQEDRSGNAFGSSAGYDFATKGTFSKTRNESARASYALDGKLSGTWKGVQDATNNIPGTSMGQCSVIQNPLFQVGSAVVITAGKAVFCFFTAGAGCAASQAAQTAMQTTLTQTVRIAIQNSIRNMFTKRFVRDLAIGAAIELSFEGIMILTQLHIEKSLALPVTGQEKGGELDSILFAGGGVANKQRSLRAGMVPATTEQYAQAEAEYIAWKRNDLKQQSFFARILDIDNPDSAAFKTASKMPLGLPNALGEARGYTADTAVALLNGSYFSKSIAYTLGEKAYASEDVSYDEYSLETGPNAGQKLAVDFAGNPQVILRDDIANIDPEENIQFLIGSDDIDGATLEPKSERFRDHIANCVDSVDIISRMEFPDGSPMDPSQDCLAQNPITVRFKAHLAYQDLVDGLEAEFLPEEIDTGTGADSADSTGGGTATIPQEGLAWPLIQSKAQAESNLGGCLNRVSQTICQAGHPYDAHDLFAPQGTQVVAAAKGEVISARTGSCGYGFGSAFTVQTYDSASNITYFYQHMDPNAGAVRVGMTVNPGDPIGRVGSTTAACNTPSHLHIDATSGRGRPACSRRSCTDEARARFLDISGALYKGYEVLN